MFDLYKHVTANPVSLTKYKSVFYSKFILRFKPPHKDTCWPCDTYLALVSSARGTARAALEENHNRYLQIANELRNQMNADFRAAKDDEILEAISFDLHKTHPLPKLPIGIVYYKGQLNLFNLGLYIGSTIKGTEVLNLF